MVTPLDTITDFPALVDYLRDELEWPIAADIGLDEATYDVTPEEIGLKSSVVGGGIEIKQLRPLNRAQPWGVFFLNLPSAKLPVTLVRNILGKLAIKKRASANKSEQAAFAKHDLLFIAATGSAPDRRLAFAHFADDDVKGDAATLKVLGWDADDTPRRLGLTEASLKTKLHWPDDPADADRWRKQWGEAFAHADTRTVVRDSKAMAKALAALARRIRDRAKELIAAQTANGSLVKLHKAFKEALIHDLTPEGFADTYAQTIAYGLLSTAISRASGALTQDDMAANVAGTSPFLKEMLGTFIEAGGRKAGKAQGLDFDELGITEVVELLRNADMEAVLADFDRRNPDEDPVIHFYELFLKEYDAAQKVKRGVFYTPRPVVGFIVRSVDEVLRTEFGLDDGLASTATWGDVIAASKAPLPPAGGAGGGPVTGAALPDTPSPDPSREREGSREIKLPAGAALTDPFVRILDPATGTGTFLVECVDLIHTTMVAKWVKAGEGKHANDPRILALWNAYVPAHLLPRLTGFELMMAPYAIAHVKLGLKLADTGYTFGSDARAQIYLTNALEPAQDMNMQLAFMSEALAHEAKAANEAKETRFTVVVGNPPYASLSSNLTPRLKKIVDPYRYVDGVKIKERSMLQFEKNIQDDYVKFTRLVENTVAGNVGVASMITNHSYIDAITLRGMRQSLLSTFSYLRIIDLHGNATKNEARYAGIRDANLFPTVAQGVAVYLGISESGPQSYGYGEVWGTGNDKEQQLSSTTASGLAAHAHRPLAPNYFFRPMGGPTHTEWPAWFNIDALFPLFSTGVETGFDDVMQAFTTSELNAQLNYFDGTPTSKIVADLELEKGHGLKIARQKPKLGSHAAKIGMLQKSPFDFRPTLLHKPLLKTNADKVLSNVSAITPALVSTRQTKEHFAAFAIGAPAGHKLTSGYDRVSVFPLWLKPQGTETRTLPNIAPAFAARVAALTGLAYDDCVEGPKQGALGGILPNKAQQTALFAPARRERGEAGRSFGPRDLFDYIYAVLHSPAYRARYADYLKSDFARIPLPGSAALFEALVPLGAELVALHLLDADALPILKDPKGVRLAGSGEARVSMPAAKFENEAFENGRMYISAGKSRWFETVPAAAADFHVGGYRPARKWLKDRAAKGGKKASPGRILTDDDILHYRRMIVALTRTAELMPQIDAVVETHGGWPGAFRGMTDEAVVKAAE